MDGYYVQGNGIISASQKCSPCSKGCSKCDDASYCQTCKSWAQKDKDGKCIEDEWHANLMDVFYVIVCLFGCAWMCSTGCQMCVDCCRRCRQEFMAAQEVGPP